MTRDQIIETMARAMCDPISADSPVPYRLLNDGTKIRVVDDHEYQAGATPYWEWYHGHQAAAALSALEAAGLVVVPTDATEGQIEAAIAAMRKPRMRLNYTPADDRVTLCVAYKAMTTQEKTK